MSIQYLVTPNHAALLAIVGYHSLGFGVEANVVWAGVFCRCITITPNCNLQGCICRIFFQIGMQLVSLTPAVGPVSNLSFESSSTFLF